MSGFKGLRIYEESYKGAKEIYEVTSKFPSEERYGIISQLRRAALSIPLNIAEGYAKRESQSEYKRFLMIAMGSSNEILVLLDFSKDVGYLKKEIHVEMYKAYEEIAKMLNGYIKSIASKI